MSLFTLMSPYKLLSAEFLVCLNFQSALLLLQVCKKMKYECQIAWIRVGSRVNRRLIRVQAIAYDTIVVLGSLRVKR